MVPERTTAEKEALKVLEALESTRLDQLFTASQTNYYGKAGFDALRVSVGVSKEAVWRLVEAIRHANGLLVLESAWGDFQVRVTPTAQLMEVLYQIDTWSSRSLFGRTDMPADEEWIVLDRLLVEEAVLVAVAKAGQRPSEQEVARTRSAVICMLYDNEPPSTEAELVAMRFYRAMRALPANGQAITPEFIREIHRMLREGEPDAGELRAVELLSADGSPSDSASPADRIPRELEAMCAYAQSEDVPFVHPLIKAIGLAWWIRHVKPFERHNHLVSRLISMAFATSYGYRVTGIIDPDRRIHLHQESGDDLTAWFIQQLGVIKRAKGLAEERLQNRVARFDEATARLAALGLNHRQALIIDHALRDPATTFTIRHHAATRDLAYETARRDFLKLVEVGYLEQRKRGKAFEFQLAPDAEKRIARKTR